jgi:hypothetical protein
MARLTLGLESIHFQSDRFFKELVLAITELKKEKAKEIKDSDKAALISTIIKNYTGFNNITVNVGDDGPAIVLPNVNKNNVLVNDFMKDYTNSSDGLRLINEAGGVLKGKVNLKTGKVSGVFADLPATLHLNADLLKDPSFSVEEHAAMTLHEVGHLETYCEYMARTVTTNQALAGLSRGLMNAKTPDEREMLLVSVKKALKLESLDAVALAKENNNTAVELVVVTNITVDAADEIGANIYDYNTWEYLSDQYATRNGAGVHLVTALDKLHRRYGNISYRSTAGYLAMEGLKAALIIGGILAASSGFLLPKIAMTLGIVFIAMDGMGDGTYDRPGVRLKRIRNDIVEALKDKKLKPEEGAQLTDDLLAIDEVLSHINDREQLFGKLWNLFSKNARKRMQQEKLAKELEGIATNDLFVQSAKLRNLAQTA